MGRYRLARDQEGYYLRDNFNRQKPLRAAFDEASLLARLKRAGRKNELVARAVKVSSGRRVLDCTAGLARDSLILAWLGCEVTLVERSGVMVCLLEDALARARHHEILGEATQRMSLVHADARVYLKGYSDGDADVIYLDPMFPEKDGSAAVRGGMQYLHRFLGGDRDVTQLLNLALRSGCDRVVLKRPARSDWQPEVAPIHVYANRNSRYEVYSPDSSDPERAAT